MSVSVTKFDAATVHLNRALSKTALILTAGIIVALHDIHEGIYVNGA